MGRNALRAGWPLILALSGGAGHAGAAVAERNEPPATRAQPAPLSLEVSGGLRYDSNVSIPEIDAATSQGDAAALLDAEIGYRFVPGPANELELSYRFGQSLHDDFSAFDIQSHMLSADLSHDFGTLDAGLTGRYLDIRLDNEAYLAMRQLSPWVSRFFGKRLFVRADLTVTDKDFEDLPPRDARQASAGADGYWFLNGARTWISFGYRYRHEDADAAQFDYRSHALKIRLSQRFHLAGHAAQAKLGWLHEARDYRGVTPLIAAQREDDRNRLQAELEVDLGPRSFARLEYEYGDYESELYTADYDQHVVSVRLGFRI